MNTNDLRERVLDLVCGNWDLDVPIPEAYIVKNEFEEGSDCDIAYQRMLDAYSRLCARLGTKDWEDGDVEIVINELTFIYKHIARNMFDYGFLFGTAKQVVLAWAIIDTKKEDGCLRPLFWFT